MKSRKIQPDNTPTPMKYCGSDLCMWYFRWSIFIFSVTRQMAWQCGHQTLIQTSLIRFNGC